jgi:hypothetical protein
MHIAVKRNQANDICTISDLYIDGQWECYILEDPIHSTKIKGATAIPEGEYQIVITHSPRFNRMLPLLVNVPQFSGVRIHPGNTSQDTEGCLLPGQVKGENSVLASAAAFKPLFSKIQKAISSGDEVTILVDRQ